MIDLNNTILIDKSEHSIWSFNYPWDGQMSMRRVESYNPKSIYRLFFLIISFQL